MMIYQDNLQILNEYFPEVCRTISEPQEQSNPVGIRLVSGPTGCRNLIVNYTFLHNRTNPRDEARQLIDQFSNIKKHSDILFYGIGLAYHIKYFAAKYPDVPFFVYEPLPELFKQFLRCQALSQMPLSQIKGIYVGNSSGKQQQVCLDIVKQVSKSILIITLPAYQKVLGVSHSAFLVEFELRLTERRNALATNSQYQKRWTSNSINNFRQVLESSNILMEAGGQFSDKPAILAASGPSLDQEIENLRLIKQRKLAYIFTAGTALNTLVRNGIHPHAAFTYDPSEENQIVCKEVTEKGIASIPLIFASTVGAETLLNYPGPKVHVISNQDLLSRHCLRDQAGEVIDCVNDASTISIIALQVLYRLGFNPVILVGQNLAYQDKRRYAAGSTYHPETTSEEDLREAVMVQDVRGNSIASNPNFVRMRQQLEYYLSSFKGLEAINTAQTGAYIEHTHFMTLSEVIKNRLHDEVVQDEWLPPYRCPYDLARLEQEIRLFNNARLQVIPLLEKCLQGLDEIQAATRDGEAQLINLSYEAFNQRMADLRSNLFMNALIEPMNRVNLELLMLAVPGISREKTPHRKAKLMESEFRPYLLSCRRDAEELESPFLVMYAFISKSCREIRILSKLGDIKLLILDGLGVLSDGNIFYSSSGEELIRINCQDWLAIHKLISLGIKVVLTEQDDEPVLKKMVRKMGIATAAYSRLEAMLAPFNYKQVAYIGRHWPGPQQAFGLRLAVQDAVEGLRREADYVLSSRGGQGALYEFVQLFKKSSK